MGDYPGSPSCLTCHHKCPCTKGWGGGQGTLEQDAVLWVLQTRMWPGAGQLLKPWEWDPGPSRHLGSPHEAGLGLRPPEPRGHVCCWRSLVVPAQSGSLPREPPGLKDHTVPRQELW